jgi:hypothetical protein
MSTIRCHTLAAVSVALATFSLSTYPASAQPTPAPGQPSPPLPGQPVPAQPLPAQPRPPQPQPQPAAKPLSTASTPTPLASKDDLAEFQKRLDELEAKLGAAKEESDKSAAATEEKLGTADEDLGALNTQIEELKAQLESSEGAIRFVPAGTTSTTFFVENNNTLRYAALFAPHFLWSFYDRALFEAHLDLRVIDGATGVNLEFAALWFVLTDHLIAGAGKFLTPFGFYNEQIHTTWLNRLPDEPLSVADHVGPSPTHLLGIQVRGAHTIARQRLIWTLYAGSAPVAETPAAAAGHDHGGPAPAGPLLATGGLDFDRYHRWALGGRIGYLPVPSIELGYSLHAARVDPVNSTLDKIVVATHGVDLNFNDVVKAIKGTIDAHIEYVLSNARPSERTDWPSDRIRQGYYAQAAYRPSEIEARHLSRVEAVVRFDYLDGLAGNKPTKRTTAGLNYWIQPSIVAKAAFQISDPYAGDNTRRTLFQLAGGF